MRVHILLLTCLYYFTDASKVCNKNGVTTYLKHPLYEFSVNILDRVTEETGGHFVFSPISSWLQLFNIAEGAEGRTLYELRNVTGKHWKRCMKRMLRVILNGESKTKIKSKSLVIVDKLLKVEKPFKKRLELLKTVRVESLDFFAPDASTDKANEILSEATDGDIQNAVVPDDFNQTSLLMNDAISFTNAWLKPFNSVYTRKEKFYGKKIVREVNMMAQTEHFNYTKIKKINAEVLELPCIDEDHSMLVFLPIKGQITDLYYHLQRIRLATIFNLFKKHGDIAPLVNVKLPRFKIETEVINLPELFNDMGVTRIFDPSKAELKGISAYPINVSTMMQTAYIKVTEEGVRAGVGAEPIISNGAAIDFVANRPFAFMIVQKSTDIPIFAGIYAHPSVY